VSLVNTYEACSIFEAAGGRSKSQSQVELVKMPKMPKCFYLYCNLCSYNSWIKNITLIEKVVKTTQHTTFQSQI